MAGQSRLRRRQAMTGFGSWRIEAEDAVSIRVYSGERCQVSCVMVAGKNLLWLVSCQPIRAYLQADSEREGARAAYQGLSSGTCGWHAEGPSLSFRMPEAGMLGSAYPRAREKACSRQVGRQGCRFIPTHGRGERRRSGSLLRRRHCFRRSIPTCVDGEGACRCRRRERHRVYPCAWANRACGEA